MRCECLGQIEKPEGNGDKHPFTGWNNLSKKTVVCYYCGIICVGTGTVDHVYPKSKLRKEYKESKNPYHRINKGNRVFACPRCNSWKKDMTLEDFKKTEYYRINCLSRRYAGIMLRKH